MALFLIPKGAPMKQFNNEQLKAIRHGDGPMMVLAGPGSGKTTVLVNRVLYLTGELKVPEREILIITFTRAAAREMEERYLREKAAAGRGHKSEACFGTFHSVFFSILKEHTGCRNEDVVTERECTELMWSLLSGPELGCYRYTSDMASVILSELGSRKNGVRHEGYPVPEDIFGRIAEEYEAAMKRRGKLDFDDMLIRFLMLLKKDPKLLSALRKRYRYIMVDEFQDINPVQYQIIRLLCEPLRNIFIVGDDDQSIYGFRGSRPEIMLGFPADFPELRSVTLEVNYRSESDIVEASLRLIRHNRMRYEKSLRACREHTGSGRGRIRERQASDEKEEAGLVADDIERILRDPEDKTDMAVLYRVHRASLPLRAELKKRGIREGERLSLMTFHGAKGLEFDRVYIISANEGITPWKLSKDSGELEEERRMFYVAMTRARHELHIFNTKLLYSRTQNRTRYMDELLPEGLFKTLLLLKRSLRGWLMD